MRLFPFPTTISRQICYNWGKTGVQLLSQSCPTHNRKYVWDSYSQVQLNTIGSCLFHRHRLQKYFYCRWRCLRDNTLCVTPAHVKKIVLTCCVLHNFMRRHYRREYVHPVLPDRVGSHGVVRGGEWRQNIANCTQNHRLRIRNFTADAGSLRDQ